MKEYTLEEIMDAFEECAKQRENLEQENKQLKELTDKYEEEHKTTFETWLKEINILTELEEWLKEQLMYFCENNEQGGFSTNVEDLEMILDKIQKLKEKYK